jgi:hypothetical protein
MSARLSAVALLLPTLFVAACHTGDGTSPADPRAAVRAAAPQPSATAVVLSLAPRVLPGGATPVQVQATLSGIPRRSTVALAFTGDSAMWAGGDLAVTTVGHGRYTFAGTLAAPLQIGQHTLTWRFTIVGSGSTFGPEVRGDIEVTCSDGLFCNGEERYTRNGCAAGPAPCNDDEACTSDDCDEGARTCTYLPGGPSCGVCAAKNCNPRCGPHQQCGDDGCGSPCVTSSTDADGKCLGGLFCVAERCEAVSAAGTCANPLPLFGAGGAAVPATGIETVVFGDTTMPGFDVIKVACGGEGIPEAVYQFDVSVNMGLEIRMLSASGDPDALDTVLAVHQADCLTQVAFSGFCSDDASPPGGLGSRVYGPLAPGSYRLIATGYSASQVGPFQFQIKFAPGCVPACDGKFCGPDGCNGECGACDAGQLCSDAGRCFTAPCTPDCGNRRCGDDGCGGSCGTCGAGELCAETEGRCVEAGACNHLRPVCKRCGPNAYCGSDCACHPVDETLVDLIPAPASTLLPSIEFEWRTFSTSSCALAESCVPGPGRWLLMRFTTDVLNQGLGGFTPGDPAAQPEFFSYHECHQHFHFTGFANYALRSLDGQSILTGRKLSYCMEDSYQHLLGPNIPCDASSTCDDQGISPGWADSYPNTLDCQWVVLRGETAAPTDVPANQWYQHETCTNTGRVFHEATFDNNCIRIPVYVPEVPDNGTVVKYTDLTLPPMP